MLNLKELKSLQSQSEALSQKRRSRADEQYLAGMDQLIRAHEQGFADPEPGRQACLAFIEAIRQNRADIRPYLMLAYLFAIFADFRTAGQYLKGAHAAAPGHPDVSRFRAAIQAMQLRSLQSEDDEAQGLAAELTALLRELATQAPPVPSPDPGRIAALSERSRAFHARQQALMQQVAALGANEDTGGLDQQLQQLQRLWHPHDAALQHAQRLAGIQTRIRQACQPAAALIRQSLTASGPEAQLDAAIESLLDQCDGFADELDALDGRGVPIDEVKPDYDRLVQLIETLQESLDEADTA